MDHHEFVRRSAVATPPRVRAWVAEDFGLDLVGLERVRLGGDGTAALWRGTDARGGLWAVKLSGGGSAAALLVQSHLVTRGVPGVPAPLPGRAGRPWAGREGLRLSVLPWIDGGRAVETGLDPEQWTALGRLLAMVHRVTLDGGVRDVLRVHDHRHEALDAAVRALQARMDALLTAPGTPDDPLVAELVRRWQEAAPFVPVLLDAAGRLGRTLRDRPPPTVLCHGDPHLGNVLVDHDGTVRLIDWDDAVLAPRDHDLMFVLGGVLADRPVTEQEQAWFAAGYGPLDVDPTGLAYHRCTRALVDLLDPAVDVLDVDRTPVDERAHALRIVTGVLSGPGLVAQAMASLRQLGPAVDRTG